MVPRRPSRRLALALLLVVLVVAYISRFTNAAAKVQHFASTSSLEQIPVQHPFSNISADDTTESITKYMLKKTSSFPHRVLFSTSTKDREFMRVYLGGVPGNNINIIPHPTKSDFWILVAQTEQRWFPFTPEQKSKVLELGGKVLEQWPAPAEQVACSAGIQNDAVICAETASVLPFGPQVDSKCRGQIAFLTFFTGARDSRVFYGPDIPYIVYGARSSHVCFGQWLQDARSVLFQFKPHRHTIKETSLFRSAVELPRPSDGKDMEKNYFLFWDVNNVAYVHYTLWPKRAFSRLSDDGFGSADLGLATAYHDQICMAKFMPPVKQEPYESIHQATNSLSITMCKRSDPHCKPDDSNTFIMHLFHHKTYYQYHAVYEPYVVLLRRYAPFEIHAIGQRPFWIYGRHNLTEATDSVIYRSGKVPIPQGHTEMFYITSMNWRAHSQKYHGYVDDVVFISFGIEDTKPGIIDILAGDLLDDLAYC